MKRFELQIVRRRLAIIWEGALVCGNVGKLLEALTRTG
jgi:hypothetical protein